VVTYGQLAALCGYPRRARQVGQVLRTCPDSAPWHRVVAAGGVIRVEPPERQQALLLAEGVVLRSARVDLNRYQWRAGSLAFA